MLSHWRRRLADWRFARSERRTGLTPRRWHALVRGLPLLDGLDAEQSERLRRLAIAFLDSRTAVGGGDFVPQREMLYGIAAQACLPILELGLDYYDECATLILYPGEFIPEHEYLDEAGVVHRVRDVHAGESWERGPVVLSWSDVAAGSAANNGYNVVVHEFAHKLDMLDGAPNGFPPLHGGMTRQAWTTAMQAAYDDHCRRLDGGQPLWIDEYAAQDPAEFFAVASEAFFELPHRLRAGYPQVYAQLLQYYRQDPAQRLPEQEGERQL